jgi:hypothetical protein
MPISFLKLQSGTFNNFYSSRNFHNYISVVSIILCLSILTFPVLVEDDIAGTFDNLILSGYYYYYYKDVSYSIYY